MTAKSTYLRGEATLPQGKGGRSAGNPAISKGWFGNLGAEKPLAVSCGLGGAYWVFVTDHAITLDHERR